MYENVYLNVCKLYAPHGICNSCNTGTSALADMYARVRGRATPEGKCGHIR